MTCYFRHLWNVFTKAEIQVTSQNKAELDKTIHEMVGVGYKNCPAAWKQVKERLAEDEDSFVAELKNVWKDGQQKANPALPRKQKSKNGAAAV
jgi:hypothetical protein